MEKIRVVVKKARKPAEIKWIENELETYNEIVGGWIETFGLTDEILIVLNEEGKIKGLEPNVAIPCHGGMTEYIVGDIVFVSVDGQDFGGLSDRHLLDLLCIGVNIRGVDIATLQP